MKIPNDKKIQNGSRIAKNTGMLYVRMMLTMIVTLYTSRVVLQVLGEDDFGIYGVVGGCVATFAILSGSLSAAISRFLTFELGKGVSNERLTRVFSTSMVTLLLMGLLVIVLGETVGLWFLTQKMVIPADRMVAAHWVFQCSLLTFVVNLISIPYNAMIIAYERMSAFAYIGIVEAILKLAIAYALIISSLDKLAIYAVLMMVVALIVRAIYGLYCRRSFEACRMEWVLDKRLLSEIGSFAGWNSFGNGSYVLMTSGVNILINLFFGVTLNAARSIAVQVDNAVTAFVNNFVTALNPQITKSYAAGDTTYLFKLIFVGARYAFYMMLLVALPIILECSFIMQLWLDEVPEYTVLFVQSTLVIALLTVLSYPLVTLMMSTGRIRTYQIVVGSLGLLVFFLTWVFYKLGYPPVTCYVVYWVVSLAQLIVRLWLLRMMTNLSIRKFCYQVVFNVVVVALLSSLPLILLKQLVPASTWLSLGLMACSVIWVVIVVYVVGMQAEEQEVVIKQIKKIVHKIQ